MNRALWFAAGTGAGVYAAVRAKRVAEALSVDGLRDRVGAAVVGLRIFRDEVAQGRTEAKTGLRDRLGVALHEAEGRHALRAAPTPETDAESAAETSAETDDETDHEESST